MRSQRACTPVCTPGLYDHRENHRFCLKFVQNGNVGGGVKTLKLLFLAKKETTFFVGVALCLGLCNLLVCASACGSRACAVAMGVLACEVERVEPKSRVTECLSIFLRFVMFLRVCGFLPTIATLTQY